MTNLDAAPGETTPPVGPGSRPAPKPAPPGVDRGLGLTQSTALIVGSIIGVGISSLPYSLPSYGPISLIALGVATVGALSFAVLFAALHPGT